MKTFKQLLALLGISCALTLSASKALAQGGGGGGGFGGGNFDPTQFLQGIVDNMRDSLAVTNDDEWKAISPRLLKVVQLQLETRTSGMGMMFGGRRGGAGGGAARRMGAFGQPDPATEALQKALDENAPLADVKAALAKVREARNQKKVEVAKAQADLRDILTPRQEATLVMSGMLE